MKEIGEYSESEIVNKVISGEKELYRMIVRKYNPVLYRIGRSYDYNHEDTQDLMQDTFVDAYKSLSQFEGRSSFKTWLIRIMLNNCYQKARKSSYKNEVVSDLNDSAVPLFSEERNNINNEIYKEEMKELIEKSLSEIPHDYRMVFSLREINGFNVSETASLLKITESNVKTRLSRAKAMLRDLIEKNYPVSELYEFNLIYCGAMADRVMEKINEIE